MSTAATVQASAVGTLAWLSEPDRTIVVPVYQRQYRWEIGPCEQLLRDIRRVADAPEGSTHFLASILSAGSADGPRGELVLIDGQQRLTTIMLLVAALAHTAADGDADLRDRMRDVLVRPDDPGRTRLRPHREWAGRFEQVVLGGARGSDDPSRFDANYAYFRSQIRRDEVPRIWRGLSRLEHVTITLGAGSNAQQVFESLNSTGEPLHDHELIHNYVLMGLTPRQQRELEDATWLPLERNAGERVGDFWRQYLVLRTGREIPSGPRAVYDRFRALFPVLGWEALGPLAGEWLGYAETYRMLREPASCPDPEVRRSLVGLNLFGQDAYPVVMQDVRDATRGDLDRAALLHRLGLVEGMLVRRAIAGLPAGRVAARLCRAREDGPAALEQAIARITPSDERVRVALKYGAPPHPLPMLARICGREGTGGVVLDQVLPAAPPDSWSEDGARRWGELSDDEQNSRRAVAGTLGNLVLLEDGLAEEVADLPFPAKRRLYAASAIAQTRAVAEVPAWTTAAIAERTAVLTDAVLSAWPLPALTDIDDDGLTPILDARPRRGWPPGWQREFDYVEYRGEHWEVHDIRQLFERIFTRLWADARDAVADYSATRGGPVYDEPAWNGRWESLGPRAHLYLGWDADYMLTAVQGVLEEAGTASEVFVKYSYIGDAMA